MDKDQIQEEAAILELAVGQIAAELAHQRLAGARAAYRRLGLVLKKIETLEKLAEPAPPADAEAKTEQPPKAEIEKEA